MDAPPAPTDAPAAPTAPAAPDRASGAESAPEGPPPEAVARGMRWSLVSTIVGRVVTPITSIVLAHLLVPADFGVFSVAVVVQSALMSFNDLGVTNALVWWKGDVRHAARTATTLATASSVALYLACFASAPAVADLLGSPDAVGVLRLLCLTVVIDGCSSVPIGLLNRTFRQDRRALADWLGFTLSTGLTIGLTVAGFGPWSLAWGRVIGNTATTAALYAMARERPRLGWDREVATVLLRYGLPLCGSSILVFAFLNVDYIMVGHLLGPAALGIYTIAFNLASWPPNVVSSTVRRVSIPVFSRLQDDREGVGSTFLAGVRNVMVVTLPLATGLSALAVPLVTLLYPPAYAEAGPVLEVLAWLGAARVLLDFMYDLLSGVGRTRELFGLQALWLVLLVPALAVGASRGGVVGVAVGHVAVAVGVMIPAFALVIARRGPATVRLARQLVRPLGAAALGWVVATIAAHGAPAPLVAILAGGTVLVGVYLLAAAPPRELRTLPHRLLRFEPAVR